jgi:cell division protein FtsB
MQKKTMWIIVGSLSATIILLLCLLVPLAKSWYQRHTLQKEIQKVEQQIELNKAKRAECSTNMQLWNSDNDKNREMLENLKKQYNDMVGFTEA